MLTILADQTPTPTRFLRTCDEIGVFDGLLNPFEQTFRHAIESCGNSANKSTIAINQSTSNVDDTLHTPHIFPNFGNSCQPNNEKVKDESIKAENTINKTIILRLDSLKEKVKGEIRSEEPEKVPQLNEHNKFGELTKKLDTKRILSKYPPIAPAAPTPTVTTFFAIAPVQVRQKLKARLLSHQSVSTSCPQRPVILARTDNGLPSTPTICENKSKNGNSARSIRNKKNVEAAKRYRERLKQKQGDLITKNADLLEQNRQLREENKRLKRFILNCKTCKTKLESNS